MSSDLEKEKAQTVCMVNGCNGKVIVHGLCDKHRKRLERHGHLKQTRPEDWGELEKHPLYNTWCWMKKMDRKFSIDEKWEDFWGFVEDMNPRPSHKHRLYRKDPYGPYSPENCVWKEVSENKDRAEYARQWRKKNPEKVKHLDLKKTAGISLEEYQDLHKAQDGVCAICGQKEPYKGYSLAVDHCHKTKKIRGLLCRQCNQAIGLMQDNPEIMKRAAEYVSAHN